MSRFETSTNKSLLEQRVELKGRIKSLQDALAVTDAKLVELLELEQWFDERDKVHGIITEKIFGLEVKASITKTVTWDSELLAKAAHEMTWQEVNNLFKVEFSMSEAAYKELQRKARQFGKESVVHKLLESVDEARTVRFSDPRISAVTPAEDKD